MVFWNNFFKCRQNIFTEFEVHLKNCSLLSCSRHRKTKFTNSESLIFTTIFLITFDLCIHFVFLSPLSNSKCIKKSSNFHLNNKKYWGFGIRKFGFSMTWARYYIKLTKNTNFNLVRQIAWKSQYLWWKCIESYF